jgi:hypothetical protein
MKDDPGGIDELQLNQWTTRFERCKQMVQMHSCKTVPWLLGTLYGFPGTLLLLENGSLLHAFSYCCPTQH